MVHTVEITEFYFTATIFLQKFRQINQHFTKELYLLWIGLTEKNLRGSEFFIFPHCVVVALQSFFREINLGSIQ